MRNRMQAEAMGFQMSSEAKEAQRQREAAEEEKLRRLLKFQQEGETKKEEESDDEVNPNLIPLGGLSGLPEKEEDSEMKQVSGTSDPSHLNLPLRIVVRRNHLRHLCRVLIVMMTMNWVLVDVVSPSTCCNTKQSV